MLHSQHFSSMDEKKCGHTWTTVNLSWTGEYVSFPSSFFHRGYFKMKSNMIIVTAQLFALDNGSSPNHPSKHLVLKNSMDAVNNGMLTIDLTRLSEDVLQGGIYVTPSVSFHHAYPLVVFGSRLNQTDRFTGPNLAGFLI